MPDSKDELIAELRSQVAMLTRLLEAALAKPEVTPGALRQRRFRERHKTLQSNAQSLPCNASGAPDKPTSEHEPIPSEPTSAALHVTLGNLIGGVTSPVGGGEDVRTDLPQETGGTGTLLLGLDTPSKEETYWEKFRQIYPKTDRTSWAKAQQRWGKLSNADQEAALNGAMKYAARNPDPQFRKAADSWLLDRRWETVDDWRPATITLPKPNEPAGYAGLREWSQRHSVESDIFEAQRA